MDIKEGSIVTAKAGRDKGGCFVVMKMENGFAYIADGKRRRVENPKKKKLIHLQSTRSTADVQNATNREIRKLLNEFKSI